VKVRAFEGLERFTWELAAVPAIVVPITPEQAKADLFGDELAITSNVVKFGHPSSIPANRSRPQREQTADGLWLSID